MNNTRPLHRPVSPASVADVIDTYGDRGATILDIIARAESRHFEAGNVARVLVAMKTRGQVICDGDGRWHLTQKWRNAQAWASAAQKVRETEPARQMMDEIQHMHLTPELPALYAMLRRLYPDEPIGA